MGGEERERERETWREQNVRDERESVLVCVSQLTWSIQANMSPLLIVLEIHLEHPTQTN